MTDDSPPESGTDPHAEMPVERTGVDPSDANVAVLLVHGRGARATGMLDFAREIDRDDVAFVAPQAHRGTWYPQSFMAPIDANQPHLDSALGKLDSVRETVERDGLSTDRIVLLGFSQGACLASEYVARNPTQYGGLVALSGGLIGPEGTTFEYEGSLNGTRAFFGCGDEDPHIPVDRVEASATALEALDADVETRIYEGMGHGVIEDEMTVVRDLLDAVVVGTDSAHS
ncbi:alpha/beta hydrolase [Halovivax gelatinilyticus]|uniref:alpha/beta hydrolase n=1 Tax=Halovivax gelatinilyticus TaxID=2961597 RepID=UPI0020CA4049|nr:dienelactone hydrolase family protein [Halovivax gelatinilyticus]